MPRKNIDWSKCAMYRIVCKNPEIKECYVGQSTNLINRRYKHKSCCNNEYNYPVYNFIRENGGFDNWEVILIEYYKCNNHEEASSRERYWKEFYNAKLNAYVPGRGKKEYYQQNVDKILENKKEYYQNNIEKRRAYQNQYYIKKKEDKIEE